MAIVHLLGVRDEKLPEVRRIIDGGDGLALEEIGEVELKGFREATALFLARAR